VFPHEPLPSTEKEKEGYVHIQGGFTPKITSAPNVSDDVTTLTLPDIATTEALLLVTFRGDLLPEQSPLQHLPHKNLISITVETTDTKKNNNLSPNKPKNDRPVSINRARLTYPSPAIAREIVSFLRANKITPASMFVSSSVPEPYRGTHSYTYSSKAIQATQVTQLPILDPREAWSRVSPPKFRRLLLNSQELDPSKTLGEVEAIRQTLEHQRNETRFIFVSNILSEDEDLDQDYIDVVAFQDAFREALRPYLTAGSIPPEIFLPSKKQHSRFKYCHVGTRSPIDAKSLITNLQGTQLTLNLSPDKIITTDKLFVDYADVTQRCATKASRIANGSASELSGGKIEPIRPECTSTTDSVVVPGLVIVPDFVSVAEEEAILAVLSGPNAPWAPAQRNLSQSGNVKRRVQHYGYVFSYETADVVRDRDQDSGCCPPMPAISKDGNNDNLDDFIDNAISEGRGWDTLAGVIERVRKFDFFSSYSSSELIEQQDFDNQSENQIDEEMNDAVIDTETKLCTSKKPFAYPFLNQLTVNEYKRGEGIGSHTDTISAFDDGLISISLSSDCVMEFKEPKRGIKKLVHLPPRSLILMSGASRYTWEHLIVSRMTDHVNGKVIPRKTRISLTLRTAICLPDLPDNKTSQPLALIESSKFPPIWGGDKSNEKEEDLATPETEKNHVHAVYDAIAKQWHHTRGKRGVLWPGATQFLKCLPRGSVVADVGCGDGKYFPAIWEAGSYVIGFDISLPLLQTSVGACKSQGDGPSNRRVSVKHESMDGRPAVGVADCMYVPLKSHSCDAAICIAVMHHLSSRPRRIRCLKELARVVKVGGCINVQAWALKQESDSRRKFAGTDVFVPFNAQPRYLEQNAQDKKQSQDTRGKAVAEIYAEEYDGLAEYDERKGLVVFQRYCHMYREGELEELVSHIEALEVVDGGFESGNYFIIAKVVETKAMM
jgi:alkylated DNA repair protein alkB family protein 8